MTTSNIVLDFSGRKAAENVANQQPLALMPAALAKKLLADYSKKLVKVSAEEIIGQHIDDMIACQRKGDVDGAISASIEWVLERDLIKNCAAENWSAYEVPMELAVDNK